MKNKYRAVLILLVLNVFCVFAVDVTTFKYRNGGGISGNGNPGLIALTLGWILLLFLLLRVVFIAIEYFKKVSHKLSKVIIPTGLIVILALMILAEIRFINLLGHNLNGFTNDKDSIVFRFGWINQYTNSLFYNGYILIFGVALALLLSWIMARILARKIS
ncbi:MAG: hypothetical protein K6T94_17275 [Paenibacillus sp.]|nr:hypothetical protein [Paenibacillus sp.]